MESVQGVLRTADLSDAVVETSQDQELLMGPAFGFVGHWYYVAGFIGLAIGGLVTGILLRAIRAYYDLGQQNHGTMVIYPILASAGFFEAAATPLYWLCFNLPFLLLLFAPVLYACRASADLHQSTFDQSRKSALGPARLRSFSSRALKPGQHLLSSE
jgi:hypothetical protein